MGVALLSLSAQPVRQGPRSSTGCLMSDNQRREFLPGTSRRGGQAVLEPPACQVASELEGSTRAARSARAGLGKLHRLCLTNDRARDCAHDVRPGLALAGPLEPRSLSVRALAMPVSGRHTGRLDEVVRVYRDGLVLVEIGGFRDQDRVARGSGHRQTRPESTVGGGRAAICRRI